MDSNITYIEHDKMKVEQDLIVTTQPNFQPNFNSIQSKFNPGWGYTVTGLNTTTHHPPPPTTL